MKIKEKMADKKTDERNTTVVLGPLHNATRVFLNDVSKKINELEKGEAVDFSQLAPYATGKRTRKMWQETGDWNDAMWSCGQSVGLIDDIPTCKELVHRIVVEAEEQLLAGAKRVSKL